MPKPQVASFPQFPRLPLELRFIIWEMAMDEPRSILILREQYHTRPTRKPRTLSVGEDNFYDVPGFFFVNQECRTVAKKVYFDSSIEICDEDFKYKVYVNMKVKRGDSLVMSCLCLPREEYLYYVERVDSDDEYYLHTELCCCDDQVQLFNWLLSLLRDDCICKNGLELCRYYRTIKRIYITLRHPFLSLEHQELASISPDE
ncbi:hypothetical protein EV127DRAFT_479344 [Xylaria flabelliformis]|nr:hypothetical protein EV127DRAFT_479344 [Xylaria flabelliformis]